MGDTRRERTCHWTQAQRHHDPISDLVLTQTPLCLVLDSLGSNPSNLVRSRLSEFCWNKSVSSKLSLFHSKQSQSLYSKHCNPSKIKATEPIPPSHWVPLTKHLQRHQAEVGSWSNHTSKIESRSKHCLAFSCTPLTHHFTFPQSEELT